MSFKDCTFKHTNTPVDHTLQELLTKKFQSLERYVSGQSEVRCMIEFAKVAPHQHGHIYRVEANVWAAGVLFRAEATEENFEKAIDAVRSDLAAELGKVRAKRTSLWRKGARQLKQMMQGRE